jgi:hypothetical protein
MSDPNGVWVNRDCARHTTDAKAVDDRASFAALRGLSE